jgi:diguanylate cyclase (GGDEF)-like protein
VSEIDKLTGFVTQKFFLKKLEEEVLRAKRYKNPLSLLLCQPNYDVFENDPYIKSSLHYPFLKQLGAIFKKILRDVDVIGRYEGDSIAALLVETPEDGAKLAGERLRNEIENTQFKGDEKKPTFRAALSIGVATFLKHAKTPHELISAAQKGLQLALSKGGNCVEVCPIVLEETPSS